MTKKERKSSTEDGYPLIYGIVAYRQDEVCFCCAIDSIEIPSDVFNENSITRAQEVGDIFDTFVEGLEPNRLKD